ncbi:hypothetical protein ACFYT4_05775 [Streptomyces sp. NPDC004609]|uniref:hypothetical protein n=1 Tax=Streptomyces sp. NPDC004609 TaxID=3364704 RepID=UPI00367F3024
MTDKGARILLALALATAVLTGCDQASPETPRGAVATPAAGGGTKDGPASPAARKMPFELYTHCGIEGAQIGPTYFVAKTPLSDGSGNPPDGWGNPFQKGTMTVLSPTEAVFTDEAGHRVEFHVQPGVKGPKDICR